MTKRKIIVKTGSLEEAAEEFVNAWHKVEAGEGSKITPIEKISFTDPRFLFKTLTARRWELLNFLHIQGKMSIRSLAHILHRDYSNVHQDVKMLTLLGLILKDEDDNKYHVPWGMIVTEFSLATKPHPSQDLSYKKGKVKRVARW